jgi:hypothetical protein
MKIYNKQAIFHLLFLPINSLIMSLIIDFHCCKKVLQIKVLNQYRVHF